MSRSGHFAKQPGGYESFVPAALPPEPALGLTSEILGKLSKADRVVGRLDMITEVLPNPDLFVGMYVRQEAVLSSQIEGTQSTLEDVLRFEATTGGGHGLLDVEEVVNYVGAMNYGLENLSRLPPSNRLLCEIHGVLLKSGRGQNSTPGQFRRIQNWIGPAGADIRSAAFVPPTVPVMVEAMGDLEKFLHDKELPVLIHAGLAHAQFETIHPFLDGNGRVGRLLITLLLCERGVLQRPVLYLSHFFKRNRQEYYDRLMAIRQKGDWEGWIDYFLRGVIEVGTEAVGKTQEIISLRTHHLELVNSQLPSHLYATRVLDHLFTHPITTIRTLQAAIGCAYVTANKLVKDLESLGLLTEINNQKRNRVYSYAPYLNLFSNPK
ncbi:MAG: Fic family protein [Sumerlaeia bacterium]